MKFCLRTIAALICFIMIAASFSSCDLTGYIPSVTDVPTQTEDNGEETTAETEPEETISFDESDSEINAVWNVLTRDEKMYYTVFERELSAYATRVTFKTSDRKSVERAYNAFTRDHPEYFWLVRSYDCAIEKRHGTNYVEFTPRMLLTEKQIKEKQAELDKSLEKILKNVPEGLTEYETALYFHDLIVENTTYDLDEFDVIEAGTTYSDFLPGSTAYGCLVNSLAICSGYSAAYQLLLQRSGIMAGRVLSATHEWNYVRLDGEYYFADLTWDDPVSDDGTSDELYHTYFMVTGRELLTDDAHNPHYSEIFVPKATATEYNYYVQSGKYIETYDFETAKESILKQYEDDVIEMRFSSEEEQKRATEDLITVNKKIFDIVLPNGEDFPSSISYSSKGFYLTIYI